LMNAVQHSPARTEVTVSLTARNGIAEMRLADRGEGIPDTALPHIFERFYRVDKARSRDSGGTGLGLAIARHVVQAQGGSIRAESELNAGSTFIFTLPLAEEPVK